MRGYLDLHSRAGHSKGQTKEKVSRAGRTEAWCENDLRRIISTISYSEHPKRSRWPAFLAIDAA